jgi:hypothetical protein
VPFGVGVAVREEEVAEAADGAALELGLHMHRHITWEKNGQGIIIAGARMPSGHIAGIYLIYTETYRVTYADAADGQHAAVGQLQVASHAKPLILHAEEGRDDVDCTTTVGGGRSHVRSPPSVGIGWRKARAGIGAVGMQWRINGQGRTYGAWRTRVTAR